MAGLAAGERPAPFEAPIPEPPAWAGAVDTPEAPSTGGPGFDQPTGTDPHTWSTVTDPPPTPVAIDPQPAPAMTDPLAAAAIDLLGGPDLPAARPDTTAGPEPATDVPDPECPLWAPSSPAAGDVPDEASDWPDDQARDHAAHDPAGHDFGDPDGPTDQLRTAGSNPLSGPDEPTVTSARPSISQALSGPDWSPGPELTAPGGAEATHEINAGRTEADAAAVAQVDANDGADPHPEAEPSNRRPAQDWEWRDWNLTRDWDSGQVEQARTVGNTTDPDATADR